MRCSSSWPCHATLVQYLSCRARTWSINKAQAYQRGEDNTVVGQNQEDVKIFLMSWILSILSVEVPDCRVPSFLRRPCRGIEQHPAQGVGVPLDRLVHPGLDPQRRRATGIRTELFGDPGDGIAIRIPCHLRARMERYGQGYQAAQDFIRLHGLRYCCSTEDRIAVTRITTKRTCFLIGPSKRRTYSPGAHWCTGTDSTSTELLPASISLPTAS